MPGVSCSFAFCCLNTRREQHWRVILQEEVRSQNEGLHVSQDSYQGQRGWGSAAGRGGVTGDSILLLKGRRRRERELR
jgi:hypothetical protein